MGAFFISTYKPGGSGGIKDAGVERSRPDRQSVWQIEVKHCCPVVKNLLSKG